MVRKPDLSRVYPRARVETATFRRGSTRQSLPPAPGRNFLGFLRAARGAGGRTVGPSGRGLSGIFAGKYASRDENGNRVSRALFTRYVLAARNIIGDAIKIIRQASRPRRSKVGTLDYSKKKRKRKERAPDDAGRRRRRIRMNLLIEIESNEALGNIRRLKLTSKNVGETVAITLCTIETGGRDASHFAKFA